MGPVVVEYQATPRLQLLGPGVAVHLDREERGKVVLPRPREPSATPRQRAERRSHESVRLPSHKKMTTPLQLIENHAHKSPFPPLLIVNHPSSSSRDCFSRHYSSPLFLLDRSRRSREIRDSSSQCLQAGTGTSGIRRIQTTSCLQV